MAHAVVDCRYFIGSFRDGDASAVANEVAGGLRAWERWRPNLDALIAGVTFTEDGIILGRRELYDGSICAWPPASKKRHAKPRKLVF